MAESGPAMKQIPLRVTPAMHDALKAEAERDDRSMAQVIRLAIRQYLRDRAPVRPSPRPMVNAQFDRILELCAKLEPTQPPADVVDRIVPDAAGRLMTYSEARTVIDTLEARKADHDDHE